MLPLSAWIAAGKIITRIFSQFVTCAQGFSHRQASPGLRWASRECDGLFPFSTPA
jgi:hypothetical protein